MEMRARAARIFFSQAETLRPPFLSPDRQSMMPSAARIASLVFLLGVTTACARLVQNEQATPKPKLRGPAFLGVVYTAVWDGMRIVRVLPRSPAERAGLTPGDVIARADGRTLAGHPSFRFHGLIREKQAGAVVRLTVLRNGDERDFEIELDERPRGFVPGSSDPQ